MKTTTLCALIILYNCFSCRSILQDEFYCKESENSFRICRKCPTLEEDCEERSCTCANVEIFNGEEFRGGSHCESLDTNNKRWCFVGNSADCGDRAYIPISVYKLWWNGWLYKSYEACENPDSHRDSSSLGNEWFMENITIIGDNLKPNHGGGNFTVPSPEACQTECFVRKGVCGAWNFHPDTISGSGYCELKSVDACCGQFTKRKTVEAVVSGYICGRCWSTRNDCPCSFDRRQDDLDPAFQIGGRPRRNMGPGVIDARKRKPCAYKRQRFRWSKNLRRWDAKKSQGTAG